MKHKDFWLAGVGATASVMSHWVDHPYDLQYAHLACGVLFMAWLWKETK